MGTPGAILDVEDRVRLTGELASPELEAAYRRRHAPHDLAVARVMVCTAAVATLGLGIIDYQLFRGAPQLVGLWAARGVFAGLSVVTLFLLRFPAVRAWAFGGWFGLTVALHVYVGTVWPAGHVELRMTAGLTVFMSYCVLPLPLRAQTVGALLHTAGALVVCGWLNPPEDSTSVVGDACWLSVVNALGLVLSYRLHARQRLLFAALLRQSELSASLGQALAEVRTLRGLIRVCAWCRKVHTETEWQQLEAYVQHHTHAEFTHGICPECLQEATQTVQ